MAECCSFAPIERCPRRSTCTDFSTKSGTLMDFKINEEVNTEVQYDSYTSYTIIRIERYEVHQIKKAAKLVSSHLMLPGNIKLIANIRSKHLFRRSRMHWDSHSKNEGNVNDYSRFLTASSRKPGNLSFVHHLKAMSSWNRLTVKRIIQNLN